MGVDIETDIRERDGAILPEGTERGKLTYPELLAVFLAGQAEKKRMKQGVLEGEVELSDEESKKMLRIARQEEDASLFLTQRELGVKTELTPEERSDLGTRACESLKKAGVRFIETKVRRLFEAE